MSDKEDKVAEEVENLNQTAHDFFWDGRKKAFMLVSIAYNRKTGNGKVVEVAELADSKSLAVLKAKELVVKKVYYSNLDDKSHSED